MEWSTEPVLNVSENVELGEMFQEGEEDYFDNELSIYEEENFQVVNCLTERWAGGFNASFVVKNTSEMDIRNWYVRFPAQFKILNIWNANIVSHDGTHYELQNAGYNGNIGAGGNVSIGFVVGSGDATRVLSNITIIKRNNGYRVGTLKYMPDAKKCVVEALNTTD